MSAAELFAGAGASPGVETWRIEQMKPVKQANFTGKFHTGDSYIVLHTWESKGSTLMNAHFWIGAESTRDEAGAAALLTVELDQLLGDLPTQFRETQGSEGDGVLQLWPTGAQYLAGGVDSAFTAVDRDAYTTRLLHVKGKRNVRVMQVPRRARLAQLRRRLPAGHRSRRHAVERARRQPRREGQGAGRRARGAVRGARGQELAGRDRRGSRRLRGRHRSRVLLRFERCRGREAPGSRGDAAARRGRVASAAEGGDDDAVSAASAGAGAVRLYHLRDEREDGHAHDDGGGGPPLRRACLKTDDVFVLCAGGGVYVWVGKEGVRRERAGANEFLAGGERAAKFLDANGLRADAPVKIVKEGTENALFKQAFHRWGSETRPRRGASATGAAAKSAKPKSEVDVAALVAGASAGDARDARGRAFDDGRSGVLGVARRGLQAGAGQRGVARAVLLRRLVRASLRLRRRETARGVLLAGPRELAGREGSERTAGEGGGRQTGRLRDASPGHAGQGAVDHFCALFQGRMVVRSGGKASGFKNVGAEDVYDEDGVCLYYVQGTSEANVRAVQVADDAACLNSGDCFILTLERKRRVAPRARQGS